MSPRPTRKSPGRRVERERCSRRSRKNSCWLLVVGCWRIMSFYAKHVLPRLIDLAMRNRETTRLRAAWIPQARGDVLEVGIGSGLNLAFYSTQVQRVYGVDPSVELQRIARRRMTAGSFAIDFLTQS